MTARQYATAEAFKQAIEQRLRDGSAAGDLARRRQLLVFDRFLARIVRALGKAVMLKGGLVLELRLERARTTNDVDLHLSGAPDHVLDRLQEAGRLDLGDFMTFEIQADARHPEIQNEGLKYDGLRFRAECKLAGKLYGRVFGVDCAFGDPILGEPDEVVAADALGFAGIAPPKLRVYPIETHLAEKLHAYTLPRKRTNSRVKDLPDLALLASAGKLEARRVRRAIDQTFSFRGTHPVPDALPSPPPAWQKPYAHIAEEDALAWRALADVEAAVRAFLDPILARELAASWDPKTWSWTSR